MLVRDYWNTLGVRKDFEDPVYLDKLTPYLTKDSYIVEYGCGYGRMMDILHKAGYHNLIGFDFAQQMIERGKKENSHLNLHLLESSGIIPCADQSADAIVMSTVLCSMIDPQEKKALILELKRLLKDEGILYLTDFLICNDPYYEAKYSSGMETFGVFGTYVTAERLIVHHHTPHEIFTLLSPFDIQWFEQFDFKTMNHNPARTFHCIAKRSE
ncbi:MAG: class I SAM-dependent methyltransferase [Chlamydiia bacterium]|nr:class I SAM-dependent methyltransferase [Chlamydiia bacterium]